MDLEKVIETIAVLVKKILIKCNVIIYFGAFYPNLHRQCEG